MTMLRQDLLGEGSTSQLSDQTGIPMSRLEELFDRTATPDLYELGRIADALQTSPMYLLRPAPSVVARRDSGVDLASLDDLLKRYDYHVAAFRNELGDQALEQVFPSGTPWAARSSGEMWSRVNAVEWSPDLETDPLVSAIESVVRVPVLIWPVAAAPFGATLSLGGTVAIWVNSYDVSGAQQRFTLAHELGHIMLAHARETHVERTRELADAASFGTAHQRTAETHANAFAGGVLYDQARVEDAWDEEETPESIARVATSLGISFTAAAVAMDVHLSGPSNVMQPIAQASNAREAFQAVGHSNLFEQFEGLRNTRRVPDIVERKDLLDESLRQASVE